MYPAPGAGGYPRDQQLIDSGREINAQVALFAWVGSALIEARQNEEDPFKKLERVVSWERS